ncbi:MAG: hypothetical protein ACYDH3_08240 [Candidatus Aminicenantales bacterium]
MKLLFVPHLYHPAVGGVELHLKHLAEGLVKRGHDVRDLTTNAYSTEAFFLGDRRRIDRPVEVIGGVAVQRLAFHTFGRSVLNFFRRIACRIPYPGNDHLRALSFGPRNRRVVPNIATTPAGSSINGKKRSPGSPDGGTEFSLKGI